MNAPVDLKGRVPLILTVEAALRTGESFVTPGGLKYWPPLDVFRWLQANYDAEIERLQAVIDGYVDASIAEADYAAAYDMGIEGLWPEAGVRLRLELQTAYERLYALSRRGLVRPQVCLKCGHFAMRAYGGHYKCRDCGWEEGTDVDNEEAPPEGGASDRA